MRFGISATSWILPKNLRTRLRPVNVCAIVCSLSVRTVRPARDDSPEGRNPSRPSDSASDAVRFNADPAACRTRLTPSRRATPHDCVIPGRTPRHDRRFRVLRHPGTVTELRSISRLLQLDLGADLLEGGLDLLGLFLVHAFLDRPWARLRPGPWLPSGRGR